MKTALMVLLGLPFLLAPTSAPTTTSTNEQKPTITLWDGGDYLMGTKPSLIFAMWEDGRVVRRVGPKLMVGKVTQSEVTSTMELAEREGFFTSELKTLAVPDGPLRSLAATWHGKHAALAFDEHHIDPQKVDEHASPSREEVMKFVGTWTRVRKQLDDLVPDELRIVHDALKLEYPKP